jgi:hypothetical protein
MARPAPAMYVQPRPRRSGTKAATSIEPTSAPHPAALANSPAKKAFTPSRSANTGTSGK